MLDSESFIVPGIQLSQLKPIFMRQLPTGFVEMIRKDCGSDADTLLEALTGGEPSLAVRVNRLKGMEMPSDYTPVSWLSDRAFYLDERPVFAAAPEWHQGR